MSDSQRRGWGPGWPNCQRDRLVTIVVGRNNLRLPVRREVAPIFAELVRRLERSRGSGFRPDWSWGFACRSISGTTKPSNHSWGLAIDLDAPTNPYNSAAWHKRNGRTGWGGLTIVSTMPADTRAICDSLSIGWGGLYRTKPDPMHFEFMGTPTDAARIASTLPGSVPVPPASQRTLRLASPMMRGEDVRYVQTAVGVPADGFYGATTESAVRRWQASAGLRADGVFGSASWARLLAR
jgi:hypothetical protein